jgi:hypothetical protein
MTGFSVLLSGIGKDLGVSLAGALERLNSAGVDCGGLEEATTLSREVEVLVSRLAVMAMICQFKCTEVKQWSKWTGHEERCGRNSGSLVDSKMAFEVGGKKKKIKQAGGLERLIQIYRRLSHVPASCRDLEDKWRGTCWQPFLRLFGMMRGMETM